MSGSQLQTSWKIYQVLDLYALHLFYFSSYIFCSRLSWVCFCSPTPTGYYSGGIRRKEWMVINVIYRCTQWSSISHVPTSIQRNGSCSLHIASSVCEYVLTRQRLLLLLLHTRIYPECGPIFSRNKKYIHGQGMKVPTKRPLNWWGGGPFARPFVREMANNTFTYSCSNMEGARERCVRL